MKNVLIGFFMAVSISTVSSNIHAQSRPSVLGNANAIAALQDEIGALQLQLESLQSQVDIGSVAKRIWQNVTGSRSFSATYTNNTSGDLEVGVLVNQGGCCEGQDVVYLELKDPSQSGFSRIGFAKVSRRFNEQVDSLYGTVPSGYQYRIVRGTNRANLISWYELSE